MMALIDAIGHFIATLALIIIGFTATLVASWTWQEGSVIVALFVVIDAAVMLCVANEFLDRFIESTRLWWTRHCDCGQQGNTDPAYHASDCNYRRYP